MAEFIPTKTELVRFRVDPVNKRDLLRAARLEDMDLSTWLRRIAIAEARKRLRRGRSQ
ncbi:MAG: hypothetical protein GWN84_05310 [Gammaproteobacteria bacterium]|nr:hypothetical protein [Gammaproteobacteria bacterium]NIR82380.1 hypothetical protein [Gammaproteobacteria bacterium]NIU03525.1 hypothetical protein [Gammaproteobacteria bacterium]NIX84799.1 hypothetical protein [Gammaproteobacteria bacterium]